MKYEIVYGKEVDGGSYKELAAPEGCLGLVSKRFPVIPTLGHPWKSASVPFAPIPVVFCYTKGQKCRAILSCIKWFSGRAGNYFAQHLVFEDKLDLIDAGPAWIIKRRKFYIETLTTWNERDKEKTGQYDWKPNLSPSDYCIGSDEKLEPYIGEKIQDIATTWNAEDGQSANTKFVLLFDSNKQNDDYRLNVLYELYALLDKSKRWNYQFCTFDGQRGGWQSHSHYWDIVFVTDNDTKTRDYYKKQKYELISLNGGES